MTEYTAAELNLPPLSSLAEFAALTHHSIDTIRRCANATTTVNGWPPLATKRQPGSRKRFVTAAAGAEWINNLPDA
ncbi:hypothetical protein [Tessaracoccus massiliensis]|uniref:hypothetical protein n=1 Tax=Tessaracoccus massiliensis TaxID=1522311 RepID=UPI0005912454|nr:hypothetical protein [Tessaracoccus massiliensis]